MAGPRTGIISMSIEREDFSKEQKGGGSEEKNVD
jgi:hypothetical protein